ncbi:MAG: imidazolonepropionase [Candidatus Marinimicrobia bacterium]|nr:imidazolonepropionase [Candidatus Neomarinimicrobiota bacterium]
MKTKIHNIAKIVSWNPQTNSIDVIKNNDILIEDNKIIDIATEINDYNQLLDAENCIVTPGFIDSHTHPIFIGNRSNEFIMRANGKTYKDISDSGGGINYSVKNVRKATKEQLYNSSLENIKPFILNGTTTIEAKSGYGLSVNDEIKSLEVISDLNNNLDIDIIPTFLGAHSVPEEYLNKKQKYIDLICEEMIPEISNRKLAVFCDVFCEEGYFNIDESRKILLKAKDHGLIPRLHADEFIYSRASELANEIGAISADHLMAINDDGIKALSDSGVIATLLPGTTFFLNSKKYANGRKLIDNNCSVSLATDFNPGTCTIRSLSNIMFLAINHCGLSLEESFLGVTYNAACSIKKEKELGAIYNGYNADLIFWNIKDLAEIPYWFDSSRFKIKKIIKNGIEIL